MGIRFNAVQDTLQVISETIFPSNLLTCAKHHSAFSTNHLNNIDKTKHNYHQKLHKKPEQPCQKTANIWWWN